MGPGIAEVANRLLSAAYGSRFAVEFRTTRIGGAGSKKKQIEDFQIAVLDSEHGSEQLLETLSGGEAVWIKRAIYDAFGIIRDRSTGQRFLTVFQDEADGALDPEARLAYFRMLEAAHLESGRRHTLVITHSQEAQEMIAQRIRMEDLQAAGVAELVETAR
jgi:exonuclease SbcC